MRKVVECFSRLSCLSVRETFDIDYFRYLYDDLGLDTVMKMAKQSKILPFIANSCVICEKDAETWYPIYCEYKKRNNQVVSGLDVIYQEFEAKGVKKVFLSENFGALLASGGDLALFASGDVDNCAEISESELISEIMKSLGFKEERRYSGNLYISAEYSNPEILPKGFDFGIQWEPLARLTLPSLIHLDDFVDWNRLGKYTKTSIKLPPLDALMYICLLHISLHSFCRAPGVRLYRDLVNCSKVLEENDWKTVLSWTQKYKTYSRLSTAAYIGSKIAELSIPEEMLKKKKQKLIDVVFNESLGILKKEPGKLRVLLIESLCNDSSVKDGIKEILFPDKEWSMKVYGKTGFPARLKHLLHIL